MSKNNGDRPSLDAGLVLRAIVNDKRLTPAERTIALKVLSHRDDHAGTCFPGQREIASYVGISQQGTMKALCRLQVKGVLWMVRGQQWEKYGHGTNQYFFMADRHLLTDLVGVPIGVKEAISVMPK